MSFVEFAKLLFIKNGLSQLFFLFSPTDDGSWDIFLFKSHQRDNIKRKEFKRAHADPYWKRVNM